MPDAHSNFAYSLVATAPSPAASGTSLVVTAGEGALFPAVPFNATIWPAGAQALSTNAEIVRVTARTTDTLTITRAQESSSARTVVVGDQIAATITVKTLTDAESSAGYPRKFTSGKYYNSPSSWSPVEGAFALTLNELISIPFAVGEAMTADRINIQVTTAGAAGALVRLGIYSDSDGLPGALLLDAGTVDSATTGQKEITISQALSANSLYWTCAVAQVAVCTVRAPNSGCGSEWVGRDLALDQRANHCQQASISGALPATATPAISGATTGVHMKLRAA